MLSISALAYLIATGLLLTSPTASLPLWTNTTSPANTTFPAICRLSAAALPCQTLYPSEYRVMNSRYPIYNQSPLHGQKEFFMLLRQRASTFQVASQVQFFTPNNSFNSSFPPNATCKLQIQLPAHDMQNTLGAEPIFNVYQVERGAGVPATWQTLLPWKIIYAHEFELGHPESSNRAITPNTVELFRILPK
ncbi:hypothetical protein GRF29_28g2443496 [Pseudopithomyces chartarum]|uniref:Ubiquitin 3 binding protein But2 C-terminal domain-containing protein n=1 Tax=Pseudopithomyces chartarum TaxID=1892770 RepID=A0AAN6M3Y7_9PLEO|nr:hypothetical protein GRF29_28g2443496 [Pseudopithomyces chartarum]